MRGDFAYCQTSALLIPLDAGIRDLPGIAQPGAGGHWSFHAHKATPLFPSWAAICSAVVILPGTFDYRDAGAIHARLVLRTSHRLNPREEIGALLGQKPSALFLIEKQNRTWTEAFSFCSGDSGCGVGPAKGCCIFTFEFFIQASVVQDHEAETVRLEQRALA